MPESAPVPITSFQPDGLTRRRLVRLEDEGVKDFVEVLPVTSLGYSSLAALIRPSSKVNPFRSLAACWQVRDWSRQSFRDR